MRFVSLHHHTTFSFMDGFGTPEQHMERSAELGMTAQAVTEHGNVSSHVRHEKAGTATGVKPIFGLEAYTAPTDMRETGNRRKWHLTVLAADAEGYRNLSRIVSRSWSEGFYQWPTVSGEMLFEHNAGLIVLSGCADSKVACDLLGGKGRETGDPDDAVRTIRRFKEVFGDRFYLETQMFPELDRTRAINSYYQDFSAVEKIPLVATADVHYPKPEDNEMQKILHAAGRNTGTVAAAEATWEYDIRLTHPTSDKLVMERLIATGLKKRSARQALESTAEIADRCNVILPKNDRIRFPVPEGYSSSKELIWAWLRDGWRYRIKRNPRMRAFPKEYKDKLDYEMSVIEEKDFIDYFLMLSDLVRYAKDDEIAVGPARGSAAASLACYLLRITEIDPLAFPTMFFERFIDVSRSDLPDVDLDFADDRRDEVRQRAIEVYGEDRVGNIGNFIRYRGKNAVNDVARVYRIPQAEVRPLNDLIIERSGGDSRFDASLNDTREMFAPAAAVFEKHPELEYAIRLEGMFKGMSVHAAGLVISNSPITDTCATYTRETGPTGHRHSTTVLAYDKKDAEYLGMMKVDILGLSTMGMIGIALDEIGMKLDDLYQIELDEPETMEAFTRGDVTGIFQFEGRATRLVNRDVAPDNFMELADINALSRPGPLFSGATAAYVEVKHGRKKAERVHPVVDEITSWSKGQVIYQEQILQIVRVVGGFDWTHAQEIRKIISLKHGEAAFNMREELFHEGSARLHGMNRATSRKIWRTMATAGTYAFNVAHCISYSMLAFWCMWLKIHHPTAFYSAALTKTRAKNDRGAATGAGTSHLIPLLRDAERRGILVKAPDLDRSGVTWTPDSKTGEVLAGFSQIPGIGDVTARAIIESREDNGPFGDWSGLQRVSGIGPKTVEKIRNWAENDDPFGMVYTASVLDKIRSAIEEGELPGVPVPTHRSDEIPTGDGTIRVTWVGIVKKKEYKDAIEDERARSGRDTAEILATIKSPNLVTSCVLHSYDDGDEDVFVRITRWKFPRFKEALENLRPGKDVIVVSGQRKAGFGVGIYLDRLCVIDPEEDEEDE